MMTIEDNGRGFDPAAQSGSRNGLENMRQRMESIGGTFQIESQPGGGTKVRIEFPLKQSEAGG
jgi:signal transduction histidine kinase